MRRADLKIASVLALAAACLIASPLAAARHRTPEELTNILLPPEHSQWLVGAISRIATQKEIAAYLLVDTPEGAQAFQDGFWARRAEGLSLVDLRPEQIYDRRAEEADEKFSEAAYSGRRTDRGAIWIVYGPPAVMDHDIPPRRGDPPLEVWRYTRGMPRGLDGKRPDAKYEFIKWEDITELYRGQNKMRTPRADRP